jgi:hypothetical protein
MAALLRQLRQPTGSKVVLRVARAKHYVPDHRATTKQYCPSSSTLARQFGIRCRRQNTPIFFDAKRQAVNCSDRARIKCTGLHPLWGAVQHCHRNLAFTKIATAAF